MHASAHAAQHPRTKQNEGPADDCFFVNHSSWRSCSPRSSTRTKQDKGLADVFLLNLMQVNSPILSHLPLRFYDVAVAMKNAKVTPPGGTGEFSHHYQTTFDRQVEGGGLSCQRA